MIHEWGHFIVSKYYKTYPRFIFGWWGIGVDGLYYKLSFWDKLIVHFSGFISGLIVLDIFSVPEYLYYIYYVISLADILAMYGLITLILKYGNRKIIDLFFLN